MNPVLARTHFQRWTGRLVRRMRRRYNEQRATLLTWHSIAREESPFTAGTGLRQHPRVFERQVAYLARHYNPISLRDLIGLLERGERPRRAVVLTFDDGYADSLRVAMPILFRRRIPMTIFPVASVIGNRDLMWQHKLAWLMAHGHERRVWDALRHEGWELPPQPDALPDFIRRNYQPRVPEVLESVLEQVGTSGPALAATHRPYLEEHEVAGADPHFVAFGNHTDTHPVLSALTTAAQLGEIVAAQRRLEELVGHPPLALAYPFGLRAHYDADSRRLARDTGHRAALDMRRRMNIPPLDPFDLSRMPVPGDDQTAFEQMIEWWPANTRGTILGGPPA